MSRVSPRRRRPPPRRFSVGMARRAAARAGQTRPEAAAAPGRCRRPEARRSYSVPSTRTAGLTRRWPAEEQDAARRSVVGMRPGRPPTVQCTRRPARLQEGGGRGRPPDISLRCDQSRRAAAFAGRAVDAQASGPDAECICMANEKAGPAQPLHRTVGRVQYKSDAPSLRPQPRGAVQTWPRNGHGPNLRAACMLLLQSRSAPGVHRMHMHALPVRALRDVHSGITRHGHALSCQLATDASTGPAHRRTRLPQRATRAGDSAALGRIHRPDLPRRMGEHDVGNHSGATVTYSVPGVPWARAMCSRGGM